MKKLLEYIRSSRRRPRENSIFSSSFWCMLKSANHQASEMETNSLRQRNEVNLKDFEDYFFRLIYGPEHGLRCLKAVFYFCCMLPVSYINFLLLKHFVWNTTDTELFMLC